MEGLTRRELAGPAVLGAAATNKPATGAVVMFDYRNLDYMMASGMMDHYSWLQNFGGKRPDGMIKRPSLYDDNYQPKALRQSIAVAFRHAPSRA